MAMFDSIFAKAAYVTSLYGFAEDTFGDSEGEGWFALVSFNRVTLLNLGEDEIASDISGDDTYLCIITQGSSGEVSLISFARDNDSQKMDAVDMQWQDLVSQSELEDAWDDYGDMVL